MRLLSRARTVRIAIAVVAVCASTGFIKAGEPQSHAAPDKPKQVDVSKVAWDKVGFLKAVSMLGTSAQDDTRLLGAMVGTPVEPQLSREPGGMPPRMRASARFPDRDRVVMNYSYAYRILEDGEYRASIGFALNSRYACIELSDLVDALGPPTNVEHPLGPHVPAGARRVVYINGPNRTQVGFQTKCAFALNMGVVHRP